MEQDHEHNPSYKEQNEDTEKKGITPAFDFEIFEKGSPENQKSVGKIEPNEILDEIEKLNGENVGYGEQDDSPGDKFKPTTSISEIIKLLPQSLRKICNRFETDQQKELILFSSLGVISGMLPNVKANYDGSEIAPILYLFIYGGYGTGKGLMSFAQLLGQHVDAELIDRFKQANKSYQVDLKNYKKRLKKWQNDESDGEPPEEPEKPVQNLLFLPANITKAGLVEILNGTSGRGVMFTNEGDELATSLKSDHGHFSDLLRKNFQHESFRVYRKTGSELITIDRPEFAVVLSGTLDQLKLLIPSPENGLFSRFMFYMVSRNFNFHDVFSDKKAEHQEFFKQAAWFFFKMYFSYYETQTVFDLTKEQKEQLVLKFGKLKNKLMDEIDPSLEGLANRLALTAYRIMMILTSVRASEKNIYESKLICSNVDFQNALNILDTTLYHTLEAYEMINKITDEEKEIKRLSKTHSLREIAKIVFGDIKHFQKVRRILIKHGWEGKA